MEKKQGFIHWDTKAVDGLWLSRKRFFCNDLNRISFASKHCVLVLDYYRSLGLCRWVGR